MTFILDVLYLTAAIVVGPFWWLGRRLRGGRPLAPLADRLYRFPRVAPGAPVIWVHGVSVGEVLAARGLIERILIDRPNHQVVVTVTTRAGYDVARREYPDQVVAYAPLDLSGAVKRALRSFRPSVLILMELEIWPNWLRICADRGVAVAVANGKMSERSLRGYRRLRRILPDLLQPIGLFCVQSDEVSRRLAELGVEEGRRQVSGNLKVDNLPATPQTEAATRLRRELGLGEVPVLVAGSTHEGEESLVAEAWIGLRESVPDLALVLAPRHLERIGALEGWFATLGVPTLRRSQRPSSGSSEAVRLVDTMGELAQLYATADLVFVGGSLVEVGGHNLLEPAAQAKPLLFGPYVWTVKDSARRLIESGAAWSVGDARDIMAAAKPLLLDPAARVRAGDAARAVVDEQRGAVGRTARLIMDWMKPTGADDV
ncbi:MAG: 3-deoxy-D-manno-octulosonic acid transferase [Planctomycetes bacterium]|nr:3-deoxy-D-manno-octulosonic acid transferase [Planctomycetota bacterium]